MIKNILVPIDNSEISGELVRIADEEARRMQAELYFVHVGSKEVVDETKQNQQFADYLKNMKITSGYRYRYRIGTSYLEILEIAKEIQPDLIIMGAHSHTMLGRLFLGSNTKYVLHHCACPVYVYKQQKMFFENKIVVPIDYSEINKPVIQIADKWAQRTGAELYFIRVDQYPYPPDPSKHFYPEVRTVDIQMKAHQMELEKMHKEIEHQEITLKRYIRECDVESKYQCVHKFGQPYVKILELQKYINAGLIMMAAHSHTMLNRLFAGSNTDYLLHHASCPMYVYKASGE